MRIIPFYLPQFHAIPENDEWWGKGFTEWVNVKAAKPLYDGHYQPRIPLNKNYYNLLDPETMRWQIKLAKEYGIYGFCFYHYWFDGHMLLEKPMEMMLKDESINIPYCISWANENWTNAWSAKGNVKTLIQQTYGGADQWKEHFDYLIPFFKDENYIKDEGKPLFIIYRPEIIPCMNDMLDYWNSLAIDNGFPGMAFAYQQASYHFIDGHDESRFKYNIEYQPSYARYDIRNNQASKSGKIAFQIRNTIRSSILKIDRMLGTNFNSRIGKKGVTYEEYTSLCEEIINRGPDSEKAIPGMFVGWDNTARRGSGGTICKGSTPEQFKKYLTRQIMNARDKYKKDMLFLFAWNEWAEGGYLEPDERYRFEYLEAVREALLTCNEFPRNT